MRNDLAEIVCIVDRSGSMGHLTNDVIGGINSFIADQKKVAGSANFTLILFDSVSEIVFDGVDINTVPDLTTDTYQVRGMTAMNDAIALGINTIGKKLHAMSEEDRPGKVIFAIMTDGDENSSREFSAENIRDMIKHQTDKYSWEFIFMAANIDVDKAADSIGIRSDNRYAFQATAKGVDTAYASLRSLTTKYRT